MGIFSCNEISSGDKRLKLEYLYKMKMQLTSMMDYSFRLNTYERIYDYKKNIAPIKKEVENANIIDGWDDGEDFKQLFLEVIKKDIEALDSVEKAENELYKLNEPISLMVNSVKERQDSLMETLDKLISKVDKE